jgi:zinc transport system substrate-binding protein
VRTIGKLGLPLLALSLGLTTPQEAAAEPRVVASILPVHALVAGVMAGVGEPRLLVPPGASPHGHQMRPSDAAALQEARLVVWIGEPLEGFLTKPLATLGARARSLELIEAPGVRVLASREGGLWEPDHAAEEHAHEADHGHGVIDPHIWLDPDNARAMVAAIAAALEEVDPANAAAYRANAARLDESLRALGAELRESLAPVRDRPFIVFHDAYQYLERAFDLSAVGAITVSPDRPPGARRLAELRERIRVRGAVCVFAEPQVPTDLVAMLVEGTGVATGELDPEGSLDIAPGEGAYAALMRRNAQALVGCLSRSS